MSNENNDNQQNISIAVLNERLKNFDKKLDCLTNKILDCNKKLDDHYVSKIEFQPVKNLYTKITNFSFGLIVLIGAAAVYAVTFLKTKFFN